MLLKNINKQFGIIDLIDAIALSLIVVYSFFSALYLSDFSEIHISLNFLNFPIFIGEVLLFICMILAVVKARILKENLSFKKQSLLIILLFFIMFKAISGYIEWGPLAFRNAAMFYYFLFGLAGFYFYNQKILSSKEVRNSFLLILLGTLTLFCYGSYYLFSIHALVFILLLKMKPGLLRVAGFIFWGYLIFKNKHMLNDARGIFISVVAAFIFGVLLFGLSYWRKTPKKKLFLGCIFALVFFLFLSSKFFISPWMKERIANLFNFKSYVEQYQWTQQYITAKKSDYIPVKRTIKVYEANNKDKTLVDPQTGLDVELINRVAGYFERGNVSSFKKLDDFGLRGFTALQQKQIAEIVRQEIVNEICRQVSKITKAKVKKTDMVVVKQEVLESIKSNLKVIIFEKIDAAFGAELSRENLIKVQNRAYDKIDLIFVQSWDFVVEKILIELIRTSSGDVTNVVWRLIVWQGMIREVVGNNLVFGMDFGKPFRSKSIEIMEWSDGVWVGWMEPHNSYVHIFYRAGIFGLGFIFLIGAIFYKLVRKSLISGDATGIILISSIFFWLTIINFEVVMELPYFAIPFWSLTGLTLARIFKKEVKTNGN